jgi:hypothetical protein
VVPGAGVDELHGDPEVRAHAAHAAFDHARHAQPLADPAHVLGAALELEARSARGHAQALHRGERVDQLFGQAVAEVFLPLVRVEVQER